MVVDEINNELVGKEFNLKKWHPPKNNSKWSHDHCEICNKEISNLEGMENQAYSDNNGFYWICQDCFNKYKNKLTKDGS